MDELQVTDEEVERGQDVAVEFAVEGEEFVAAGEAGAAIAAGEAVEELQGDLFKALEDAVEFFGAELADAGEGGDVAAEVEHFVSADGEAEVLAGDVFDFVRFVEDHGVVIGQDLPLVGAANGEIGEEEVVVDDDDVGIVGALVHQGDEAAVELGAFGAGAEV